MICPSCDRLIPDGSLDCPLCGETIGATEAGAGSLGVSADPVPGGERRDPAAGGPGPEEPPRHGRDPPQRTSAAADQGDAKGGADGDPAHRATGGERKAAEDLGPYSEGALALMLEKLRQPATAGAHIPTIVVIGSTKVGKSFFLTQVVRRTQADYQHRVTKIDPAEADLPDEGDVMRSTDAAAEEEGEESGDDIEITRHVFIHELTTVASDGRSDKIIRLIDLPGEFFQAALEAREKIAAVRIRRVAMLYAALGAAEGIVFLVPGDHVMTATPTARDADIAQKSAVLMGQIRQTCNMMEAAVRAEREARGGGSEGTADGAALTDLERAVRQLVALETDQVLERMKREGGGRSQKPVVALFSRADLCFGVGEGRSSLGVGGQLREHDPFWCAARYLPPLVRQLKAGFDDFKIDFLTAAEGHSGGTRLAKDAFCLGELKPIAWLLQRIEARRRPPPASRIPPLVRKLLLLDIGDKYRNGSRWAVEMREKADSEFGRLMGEARL
ncbi:MAG: hypothetical protein JOZ90_16225 [Alphaproteobacteria bacterium]|nr:hypothetical protein [Alphaproteobacteria bacterium]MBV9371996.1 hypothetical protein [Alphaproteobacteria bacterium]MBV9902619.1 hypothetical protein [Alphaproteobacteria bacterium]